MNLFLLVSIIIIIIIVIIIVIFINYNNNNKIYEKFETKNLIKFMKCIFFTNKQFNNDKIHIPTQSLYIEKDIMINKTNDINIYIDNIINKIYDKLNIGNTSGIPVRIPAPIFALIGRKLEYDNSIFDNEKFKSPYLNQFKYGTETIIPNKSNGELAITTYLKTFFKSGLGDMPNDENKLLSSFASSYKFKKTYRIIIYVPYLTKKYKYVSNFTDIVNSSRFFHTLLTSNNFLNFKKTKSFTYESLKNKYKNYDDRTINFLLQILTNADSKIYTFYEDLQHLCLEGGCVSDYGEDLTRLTTVFTDDMGKNNEEAINKSPYIPNKCLAQTKGYITNIRDIENNIDISKFLKTYAMKEISENLTKYIDISNKIAQGDKEVVKNEESSKIADFTSPIDLIISIINKYIKNGYSTNLNDNERDGMKLNHYSKEYSKNIIKELSLLNKIYPGIPEMVMSLYIIDDILKKDKIIYHPWGRKLLSARNVFTLGNNIPVEKSLFSFNNKFVMTVSKTGIIYTYNKSNGKILYFLNRNSVKNTQSVSITTTGLIIEYIASDKNKKSQTFNFSNNITSLIGNCKNCQDSPFNLILSDKDGSIIIYANSFFDARSMEFKNFMDQEIKNGERLNMNINDEDFIKKIGSSIEIGIEEDYIFCADKDEECKK